MNLIEKVNGKLIFPFLLIAGLILSACGDNNVPTTPNYPPNVFAQVSGTYDLYYQGQGKLFLLSDPYGIMLNSFYRDSSADDFYLGINIYFKDGVVKTGTFPIVDKADTLQNYAVAFFESANQGQHTTFISYTGEITIEEISINKLKAVFNFLAKDSDGNSVMIKNGNMNIIE